MCATSSWSASVSTGGLSAIASTIRPLAKHVWRHGGTARRSLASLRTRARYGIHHTSASSGRNTPSAGPAAASVVRPNCCTR